MASRLHHIAFILDGNRRWALQHRYPVGQGHKQGLQVAEDILEYCAELHIPIVTLYAFSSENWKRSNNEKELLFQLLENSFQVKVKKVLKRQTKIKILGDHSSFPPGIQRIIHQAQSQSKHFTQSLLQVALGYGGQNEIIRGIKRFVNEQKQDLHKANALDKLSEVSFKKYLDTGSTVDPDLLIRTGGEIRLSNFLLYQMAYTELYFTKTLWPDFSRKQLKEAIDNYYLRKRHYGV